MGTQKNRLNEKVLLSAENTLKLIDKERNTILLSKVCLTGPMVVQQLHNHFLVKYRYFFFLALYVQIYLLTCRASGPNHDYCILYLVQVTQDHTENGNMRQKIQLQ